MVAGLLALVVTVGLLWAFWSNNNNNNDDGWR